MKAGLVSVTFRQLPPKEVLAFCRRTGLDAIEWGGDLHVPHGERDQARQVAAASAEAGVEIVAYGSYYRLGRSASEGLAFQTVIETARALAAPRIRIWAGTSGSQQTGEEERGAWTAELRTLADQAQEAGIDLVLEWHVHTLTDRADSTLRLLREVDRPNVGTLWQPEPGHLPEEHRMDLAQLRPWLSYLHVNHRSGAPPHGSRAPLVEGADAWRAYLAEVASARPSHALLEFTCGNDPAHGKRDAQTLRGWLEEMCRT